MSRRRISIDKKTGVYQKCGRCKRPYVFCEACHLGRWYCSRTCQQAARKKSLQNASKKYQRSDKGKAANRLRQQRFRDRKKAASISCVTHHSPCGSSPAGRDFRSSATAISPLVLEKIGSPAAKTAKKTSSTPAMKQSRYPIRIRRSKKVPIVRDCMRCKRHVPYRLQSDLLGKERQTKIFSGGANVPSFSPTDPQNFAKVGPLSTRTARMASNRSMRCTPCLG